VSRFWSHTPSMIHMPVEKARVTGGLLKGHRIFPEALTGI
jgi:hypothetical protein